jgi:HEAT repeat protein
MPLFGPNVRKMKSKGDVDGLVRALANQRVRQEAVHALGELGAIAMGSLVGALKDEDAFVREGAIEALGAIGGEQIVQPLIDVLTDRNELLRRSAIKVLGAVGDERAVEPLINTLDDKHETWLVRALAAKALGEIGDRRALESLLAVFNDQNEDGSLRSSAANALGWLGDERAVEPLVKALESRQAQATQPLFQSIKDRIETRITGLPAGAEDSYVAGSAAEALGMIGDQRALGSLIATLGDGDPSVRKAAARGLVVLALQAELDMPVLLGTLKGSEDPVLSEAAGESVNLIKEWDHVGTRVTRAIGIGEVALPRVPAVQIALSGSGEDSMAHRRRLAWMAAFAYAAMNKMA